VLTVHQKGHVSTDWLVRKFRSSGEMDVLDVKSPEVPKSIDCWIESKWWSVDDVSQICAGDVDRRSHKVKQFGNSEFGDLRNASVKSSEA
jgi:hypothetical protein